MKQIIVPILLLVIVGCSCNTPRYIYSPSPPNNPYFSEKGESKLAAYFSTGANGGEVVTDGGRERNDGFDLQAAYAVGKDWALTASYFNRREKDIYSFDYNFFDSSVINYKRYLADFGGGYFAPINSRKTIFFNLYAGLGFGEFSFTDVGKDDQGLPYSRSHSNKVTKWFFQPSINFMPGKYFRFSVLTKLSFLRFRDISTTYTAEELAYFGLNSISKRTLYFFEPSFNMQAGIPKNDWVKLDFGFTFSADPVANGSNAESRSFNASIGLSFDLSRIKK